MSLFPDILALDRAFGRVTLRPTASAAAAKQVYEDLIKRVRKAPDPDDSGVPAAAAHGPRKPAGGACAALALQTKGNV